MKSIRFISLVTLVCNICFLLFILFNWLELFHSGNAVSDTVERLPFFKEIIVILGFSAIIINAIICLLYLILLLIGKRKWIPMWPGILNVLFFPAQIYYFFLT